MPTNLFDLSGKTALITGATHGPGMAMAKGLGNAGARLVVNGASSQEKLDHGIGPGYFATSQKEPIRLEGHSFDDFTIGRTPAGRWGDPTDLQGAAIFLSPKATDFIDSQII